MLVIMLQASSVARHAFYELFLHLHIALIVLTIVILWMHLDGLPQRIYLTAVIGAWIIEVRLSVNIRPPLY